MSIPLLAPATVFGLQVLATPLDHVNNKWFVRFERSGRKGWSHPSSLNGVLVLVGLCEAAICASCDIESLVELSLLHIRGPGTVDGVQRGGRIERKSIGSYAYDWACGALNFSTNGNTP